MLQAVRKFLPGRRPHVVGTRGNVPAPAPGTQWDSLTESAAGAHSEKPEWWLELIEAYLPKDRIESTRPSATRLGCVGQRGGY
jgi:hypothetical protein